MYTYGKQAHRARVCTLLVKVHKSGINLVYSGFAQMYEIQA